MAVRLSQLVPSDIRTIIPTYINNGQEIIEEKITIYNPDNDTVKKIIEELKETDDEQKIIYTLIKYCTDIEITEDNAEDFVKFMTKFSDTNRILQLELSELWTDMIATGFDAMQKLMSVPESKRAKHIVLNPAMAEAYEQLKQVQSQYEEIQKEPEPTPSDEELEIMRKAEELKAKYKKE